MLLLDSTGMLIETTAAAAIAAYIPGIDPFLDLVGASGDNAVAVSTASYLTVV
jgi:hypothetical protein